jgi:broad specificity phosphatase PhoE
MAGSKEILLARHGETDDNAAGRFQGQRNPPLNDRGREQARALGAAVAGEGLVALYASPLRRARETAEIAAAALGHEPVFDERLMEIDVGDWAGLLHREILDGHPGAFEAWRAAEPSFRFPGGESVAEQAQRVRAAIADVRAAGRLPALVVCHGGTIRAALGSTVPGVAIANGAVHRL